MKAFRLVLVAALATFTMMGMAQNVDRDHAKFKAKYITVQEARGNSDIAYAIRLQIDPIYFLNDSDQKFLVALVKVKGTTYEVCGTYEQWYDFFYGKRRNFSIESANKSIRKTE